MDSCLDLQDCIVYLSKSISESDRQKLSTIILDSLGILVGQFNKNMTHFLCRDSKHLDQNEEKLLARYAHAIKRPRIVYYKWLLDSMERKELLSVSDYAVLSSVKRRETFSGLSNPTRPPKSNRHSITGNSSGTASSGGSLTDGLAIRPLIRRQRSLLNVTNSQSSTASFGSEIGHLQDQQERKDFWEDLIYDVHGTTKDEPRKRKTDAAAPKQEGKHRKLDFAASSRDAKPPAPETATTSSSMLLQNIAFRALGFSRDETAMLRAAVEQNGGLWDKHCAAGAKYLIVPLDKEVHIRDEIDEILVTECWLEACLDDQAIIEPSRRLIYQPYFKPDLKKTAQSFGITGFEGIHRDHVKRLVESAGFKFTERFSIKQSFLIGADDASIQSSRKFEMALEWKTPVVRINYIEDCIRKGQLLSLGPEYLFPSQDHFIESPNDISLSTGSLISKPLTLKALNSKALNSKALIDSPIELNDDSVQLNDDSIQLNEPLIELKNNSMKLNNSSLQLNDNLMPKNNSMQLKNNSMKLNDCEILITNGSTKISEIHAEKINSLVDKTRRELFKGAAIKDPKENKPTFEYPVFSQVDDAKNNKVKSQTADPLQIKYGDENDRESMKRLLTNLRSPATP